MNETATEEKPKPGPKKYIVLQYVGNMIGAVLVTLCLVYVVFGLFESGQASLIEVQSFLLVFIASFMIIQCHTALINTRKDYLKGKWITEQGGPQPDNIINPWRRIGPLALPAGIATAVAVCFMAFCGVLFFAVPELFLICFQRDAEVLRIGKQLLWVAAVFQVFDAVAMVAVGALNGTGDTRYTMVISVGASWFVLIPVAYFLGVTLELGALGAWLGITANILVVAVLLTIRFYGGGWRGKGITVQAGSVR